tara:strand:- start:4410 stop:4931 length:522 start_codon:yes stop_codon:yes gene_type:complete
VRSKEDKRVYIVRNLEDKNKAASTLAKVRQKLEELISKLKEKYGDKNSKVNLLIKRFNSNEIREALPLKNQTSYSINKGEKIVLCLRSRDSKQSLTDINTLVFVALHEIAHVMSISIGHKTEFWENFRFLLAHAIHWKIYKEQDFKKKPKPYCGLKITSSPLDISDMERYLKK